MIHSSFLRNSLVLLLLAALLLIFTIGSDNKMPQEVQAMQMEQPELVDMGIMYVLPQDVPDHSLQEAAGTLSASSFINWYRYPPEEQTWLAMTNATAYYRDVTVAGMTYISGAVDGETWSATAIRPDGTTLNWGTLTFHSDYNDNQNCFVCPWWTICGTTALYVRWYTHSQCAEPGQWTMTFYNNGVQFYQGTFKVLPQIPPGKVPIYNQLAYNSPITDHYANVCWDAGTGNMATCNATNTQHVTIAEQGCYLTSCCMILGYHGVIVTPDDLNTWLISNNGYHPYGNVDGSAVAKYAQDHLPDDKGLYFKGWALPPALPYHLCLRGPQLAWVRQPGQPWYHHWVTVTGENEARTTYKINDPWGGVAILLTDRYQDIGYINLFEGPEYEFKDDLSRIRISFHSPGELLITDPQGLRLGYDPITGQSFNEIPNGWYVEEYIEDPLRPGYGMRCRTLEIMRPDTGDYDLTITGTGDGTYDFYVRTYDIQSGVSTEEFSDVPITTDAVHSYLFNFDNTPGSQVQVEGGYDGGGQRPRDVNKFLSYGTISSKSIDLPAGTTSFALLVVYDEMIVPGSFEATADGVDISSLFAPAPRTSEIVNIPLHSGRNVVILSVEGNLPKRIARDTDRLVFKVSP